MLKVTIGLFGISALLVLAVACNNGEAAGAPEGPVDVDGPSQVEPAVSATAPAQVPQAVAPATPAQPTAEVASSAPAPVVAPPAPAQAAVDMGRSGGLPAPTLLQTSGSQAGIWVTGNGSLSLEPDLVLLNIGVETMRETVAAARDDAATAMAAILLAVKEHGLEDKDIQTRSFSIFPRYEFPEVIVSGARTRRQVLVGYTVSNTASIKIRDLGAVGTIIDDVAGAGGDATRINGISFTVEDPKQFTDQLREEAVKDAIAKAEHFAALTGVAVGRLMFISESGGRAPIVRNTAVFAEDFAIARAAAPPTSISGGELELRLSVQVVFAIQ